MIASVIFIKPYRCYKKGRKINFRPGINLLVGDQGCGKSTLLQLLVEESRQNEKEKTIEISATPSNVLSFDFEKDNPRTISDTRLLSGPIGTSLSARFISHGEFNVKFHDTMGNAEHEGAIFLLDEPETSLSPRSCRKVLKNFMEAVENKCQVIAAVHNPILIESVEEVLSLEHKRWMKSKKFLESHLK